VLVPVYLLLGAMFVSIDLSTVSFAQHFGHRPLAGFILGTYALGSATGGLWYGSRQWRAPVESRFAVTLTLTVIGVATFCAQPNLVTLTCGIYLCGLAIAPTTFGRPVVASERCEWHMTTTGTACRDAHWAIAPGNASASWMTITVGAN